MVLNICLLVGWLCIILIWKARDHNMQFWRKDKNLWLKYHWNTAAVTISVHYLLVFLYAFNIAIIIVNIKFCVLLTDNYIVYDMEKWASFVQFNSLSI